MANDLTLFHTYGVRADLSGALRFIDDKNILYPSGSYIVCHNLETNFQRFIPLNESGANLTSLAIGKGQFLAYGERSNPYGAIIVHDLNTLRKKRTMVTNEVNSNVYLFLDFTESAKHVVGVGGPPSYNLVYWLWEKTRLISVAAVNHEVRAMKVSPHDPNRIALCGPKMVRTYRLDDEQLLKLEPKSTAKVNEFFDFVSLAWMSASRMVLGTSEGQIILWDDGNLIRDIMNPNASLSLHTLKAHTVEKPENPRCYKHIVVHHDGLVSSAAPGILVHLELNHVSGACDEIKDMRIIVQERTLEHGILDEQKVLDVAMSPNHDLVAVLTERCQLFAASMQEVRQTDDEFYKLKPLLYNMHVSPVTGVDICVRKPLVATCAADRSVRIWNFYNRDCEIWKRFTEEPQSVAIHPSGLYLLAGFIDKLKLMHVLNDDIKTVRELSIRGCREVRFSNGGHQFAAANGSIIQIYSTIHFDNLLNLKGHTSRIRVILWSRDDIRLWTASQDGSLMEWDLLNGELVNEVVLRGGIFTSLVATPEGDFVYAVTSDGYAKEIQNGVVKRDIKCPGAKLTSVCLSTAARSLLFGTTEGQIKALTYPLAPEGAEIIWTDTAAHFKEITKTTLSYDGQLLISTSTDGSVSIWKTMEGEIAKVLRRDKPCPYAEEILIDKTDLDAKNKEIRELMRRIDEITLENEYQKRAKDSLHSEKMKDITESFTKEVELLKVKNERQAMEKDQADQQHQQEMSIMVEKFNHDMLEQERITNQKLLLEYEKYAELILEKERQETEFKESLNEVAAAKEAAIEKLTAHYETKIESLHTILEKTQKEFAEYSHEHDELRLMIEEDADMEIIDIRARYETAIFELKESNMKLKGENGVMKKKISNLLKDIDDQKAEVMKFQSDLNKQLNITRGLEKEIDSWKKELKEREETVQEKEKRIHELKKKNQELEKFKFVLDFKIKELRKQIEPKDDEISDLTKQIKELEENTGSLSSQLAEMTKELKAVNETLRIVKQDRETFRNEVFQQSTFIKRFQGEMELALDHIVDPPKLKDLILSIAAKYVRVSQKKPLGTMEDETEIRERQLQREAEKANNALRDTKSQCQRKVNVLSTKLWSMMQQNTNLIEEINVFRRDITQLRTRLELVESALQGTNPNRKEEQARMQSLKNQLETAQSETRDKTVTIEMYQKELRRLHLLIVLLREVVNHETNPQVSEVISRLEEVKFPPVVSLSTIDPTVRADAMQPTPKTIVDTPGAALMDVKVPPLVLSKLAVTLQEKVDIIEERSEQSAGSVKIKTEPNT